MRGRVSGRGSSDVRPRATPLRSPLLQSHRLGGAPEGREISTGRSGLGSFATETSYDAAVAGYQAIWDAIARAAIIEYFPVMEPGWDSRPWDGDRALVRTERHPEKFKRMLGNARRFVDRQPLADGRKIVLIEAWNEYGEGAVIEPHCEWRFAYLDAIRDVFSLAPRAHRDVTPWELGLSVPQVVCPPERCPDPSGGCR